ncbi:hypothetical protein BCPG3_051 [Bacillus phage BCPG3]|nr:hypothetical protein BPS13_0032 [Bacillus phage BPS13]YP_009002918.1 hypothetical protein BPS10C_032 [Bacillus phage BPS10C]QQO38952.1 hypothetical protein BCPG1_221 [Bacillus phage BCPG1]QSJ04368.1 hypothetical protein BCPG3_051 [Bacillus phage BCPG3]QSJ04581.1 hypothetical protein BCP18_049 [Bacillus phage BCP18]AEZ50211.1 hypothetical protein BPS13_0032 [Bacillus phage BPS13]AGI12029.1 hypothetical protein BPS10C_032 [Bacillus phage BPS10C]
MKVDLHDRYWLFYTPEYHTRGGLNDIVATTNSINQIIDWLQGESGKEYLLDHYITQNNTVAFDSLEFLTRSGDDVWRPCRAWERK